MEATQKVDVASELDNRTEDPAYIVATAAVRFERGLQFHVKMTKPNGARLKFAAMKLKKMAM